MGGLECGSSGVIMLRPLRASGQALRLLLAFCAALLAACDRQPGDLYSTATPPMVLAAAPDAGVVDLRAQYRTAVCARLPANGRSCDDVLLRLAGEGDPAQPVASASLPQRFRIGLVPGFLSECFDRILRPFTDVERELRRIGFDVVYFEVPGRGTTVQNAAWLAKSMRSLDPDPRPFILFAHSKGLVDVMELVASHPAEARMIAAVVGIAGAANGSPLADTLLAVYRQWVSSLPMPGCTAGAGNELEDLRRDVRLDWWRRNRRLITMPIFTIVAAPSPDRISPGAKLLYRRLAQIDARNDGRLIWYDQIVSDSHLLGYVNADHWGIVLAVGEEIPVAEPFVRDDVPRVALIEGAIDVVAASLPPAPESADVNRDHVETP